MASFELQSGATPATVVTTADGDHDACSASSLTLIQHKAIHFTVSDYVATGPHVYHMLIETRVAYISCKAEVPVHQLRTDISTDKERETPLGDSLPRRGLIRSLTGHSTESPRLGTAFNVCRNLLFVVAFEGRIHPISAIHGHGRRNEGFGSAVAKRICLIGVIRPEFLATTH
jgi:hypothetical protein